MDSLLVLRCRALLFDCDGVLVDSADTVTRSWTRWALRYSLDPAEVTPLVHGRRSVDTVHMLMPPQHRAQALRTIDTFELEDAGAVRSVAGAHALVSSLPQGSWAVVTSGTTALALARLDAAGIPLPRVVVTADDVTQGKPDPEGYLAAASELGVSPASALVLEDSASGVEAGREAGVAAVVGIGPAALNTDADVVVTDLTSLAWAESGLAVPESGALRPAPRPSRAP
jgi:sugar-phosphatase